MESNEQNYLMNKTETGMDMWKRGMAVRGGGWGTGCKRIKKKKIYIYIYIYTDNSVMIARGKEGWTVGGGNQREENGDGKRLCLG